MDPTDGWRRHSLNREGVRSSLKLLSSPRQSYWVWAWWCLWGTAAWVAGSRSGVAQRGADAVPFAAVAEGSVLVVADERSRVLCGALRLELRDLGIRNESLLLQPATDERMRALVGPTERFALRCSAGRSIQLWQGGETGHHIARVWEVSLEDLDQRMVEIGEFVRATLLVSTSQTVEVVPDAGPPQESQVVRTIDVSQREEPSLESDGREGAAALGVPTVDDSTSRGDPPAEEQGETVEVQVENAVTEDEDGASNSDSDSDSDEVRGRSLQRSLESVAPGRDFFFSATVGASGLFLGGALSRYASAFFSVGFRHLSGHRLFALGEVQLVTRTEEQPFTFRTDRAALGASFQLVAVRWFALRAGASVGAMRVAATGTDSFFGDPRTSARWVAAATGGLGLEIQLHPLARLHLMADVLAVTPRPRVESDLGIFVSMQAAQLRLAMAVEVVL